MQLDLKDLPVLQVQLVHKVLRDRQELSGHRVILAQLAHKEPPDHKVQLDLLDLKGPLVLPVLRVLAAHRVNKALLALLALLAFKAQLE